MHLYFSAVFLSFAAGVFGQDGYASQNGGTTGGKGGTTTTVSAAAAFQTAVKVVFYISATQHVSDSSKGTAAKVVYLKGAITLSSQASVGACF